MEGASFGTIGALFLLGGVSAGAWCYMDLESKRSEARECRKALETLQEGFDDKQKALDTVRAKVTALQTMIDTKEAADSSIATLQRTRESLLAEFVAAVGDVRTKSVGSSIGAISLPNGETLSDATIQSISEVTIALSHSGGVTRLRPSDLPENLRQRFRTGMFPMTSAPVAKPEVAKTGTPTPGPASTPPPPPSSGPIVAPGVVAGAKIKVEIEDIEKKVMILAESKSVWKARAESLHSQALNAQGLGKPSYTFSSQAAAAEKNITLIDAQIYQLQGKITDLRKKMIDVTNAR